PSAETGRTGGAGTPVGTEPPATRAPVSPTVQRSSSPGLPVAGHRNAVTDGPAHAERPSTDPASTGAAPTAQGSVSHESPVAAEPPSSTEPASAPTAPTAQRGTSTEVPVAGHGRAETDRAVAAAAPVRTEAASVPGPATAQRSASTALPVAVPRPAGTD